jgi:3-hydroxybutyryl-CoA dehydrogenase
MGKIESVAIVGAGFMGSGIAESVAVAGVPVIVRDAYEAGIDLAGERLETSLSRAVSRGKLSEQDAGAAKNRIKLTTDLQEIADADLVVEAVPEQEPLKLEVLRAISDAVREEAIVASNTSSIPITQLAQAVSRPERMLGMHFFSPVPVMPLVELVVALDTTPETLAAAREFTQQIGKTPIQTKDRGGFVVNFLLVPYLNAAIRMLEEGFASREDIDTGMRLGCGYPMGPLTLSDFIGLDVHLAVCDSMYEEFKRSEYEAPPLLKRMVAAGRLGRKSGRGFYEY